MLRIDGAATLGFAHFDLDTALGRLAGMGFKKVELSHMGDYCRHYPYRQTDPENVKQLLSKHGLKAVSMNICLCRIVRGKAVWFDYLNADDREDAVQQGCWYLDSARALGVGMIKLPTAGRVFGADWQRVLKPACDSYRRIATHAGELGITVQLEVPHLYQIIDNVQHTKAVFEQIDHPSLGAVVDTSHWGIIGYDPLEFFEWLGSRLGQVHLRDSAGADTRDGQQNLELTPGQGAVDFVKFRKALEQVGFKGLVTLDFEYRGDDVGFIENEFREGLVHLKKCGWEPA